MRKFFLFLFLLTFPLISHITKGESPLLQVTDDCYSLYTELCLQNVINYTAFQQAYEGYNKILQKSKEVLTIIDFTKPSTQERLYVIDMNRKKLLYTSYVSHGKNSGENYATSFSNIVGSHKSSLGFYLTENTYSGKSGYSLVLNGLEKGINDKAKERAIVIHGADYSNPEFITSNGRLGRSQGCPALPQKVSKSIINAIKDGSLLYIYANDKNYVAQTKILSNSKNILLTKK